MNNRASGVTLSYLLIGVKLVVTLLFTPFLVRSLGIEGYGLYALVGTLAAYLYILDFGMNDTVLRFFVEHENDKAERDDFLSRMLGLYAIIGALVLLTTFGLSLLADNLFGARNGPEQIEMLTHMILITGGGAAVLVALNPIGALLSATESFVFLRSMEILLTILSTLVMVVVLKAGGGAVEVVAVTAAATALQALIRLGYAVVVLHTRVRFALPERALLKRVGGYAAPIFVSVLAGALFWRLDTILIGAILGAAPIAVYAIGVTFNKYFMSFANSLSRVMAPEIIRQVERGADASILTDLMIRISRIQAIFLLLILSGLTVFGQRFLVLWLGPEFSLSYWIMLVILVPYTFELSGNARNIILQVKGLYWYKSAISFIMAALNVPLTLILLRVMGVFGAALSTGIAILVGYFLIALLLKVKVGMEMGRYFMQTVRGIVPLAAVVTVAGLLAEPFLPQGWLTLIAGAAVFTGIFGLVVYFLGANQEERAFIAGFLGRFRLRGARNV